ncbi:MAG: hypothetical protein IH991_16290, partial [Planctomycetes bacterium]|nr:hypothetical protein [Planctomycetota bacterium]
MSLLFVTFGLSVALFAPPEAVPEGPKVQAASDEAIAKAVRELGDDQFSVREKASRFLWRQGLAAEAALVVAAKSKDAEVRARALRILNEFRSGILPDTPAEIVSLIRQFRSGDPRKQQLAFRELINQQRFTELANLIRIVPDVNMRRQMLTQLMQNPKAVEQFIDLKRLEALIESVAADKDEAWRRAVMTQLLFSNVVLARLAERNQLDIVIKAVERERSVAVRREMISMLFRNQQAMGVLLQHKRLALVFKLVSQDPDKATRSAWIRQILRSPQVVKHLAEDKGLEQVLAFAQKNLEAGERRSLLFEMFRNDSVVGALLANRKFESLVALASTETDAATRGQMLGSLLGSNSAQRHLTQIGQTNLLAQMVKNEKEVICRRELIKTAIAANGSYMLLRDAENQKAIWEFVKSDGKPEADHGWRGDAVLRVLSSTSAAADLLGEKSEAIWLLDLLQEKLPKEHRGRILAGLFAQQRVIAALVGNDQFEPLLELAKAESAEARGRLLGRLVGWPDVTDHLAATNRLPLLIALAEEEKEPAARQAYLHGLFGNVAAMSSLMQEDFYDQLFGFVQAEPKAANRAALFGSFVQTTPVVQQLVARKQVDMLLKVVPNAKDDIARRNYLKKLFSIPPAMTALIENGHFDALVKLARSEADAARGMELARAFYLSPKVIDHLFETRRVAQLLEFAKQLKDPNQFAFLRSLYRNQ